MVYEFEDFRLDTKRQRLYRSDEVMLLPPKAIELLTLLVENQGQLIEKESLIEILWQNTFVEEANLTQTVYLLRKALGKTKNGDLIITTLPKRGYKFLPAVRRLAAEEKNQTVNQATTEQIIISGEEGRKFAIVAESSFANVIPQINDSSTAASRNSLADRKYLIGILLIILLVVTAAFFAWRSRTTEIERESRKNLVVVPFNVISDNEPKKYLGFGLADTLITRLGRTGKISVRPTDEIQRYANAEKDPLELGRRLNADVVLTGTVQQFDSRARLNVQLLSVTSGQIIWSSQFDENASDLFVLQDKLTGNLAEVLTLQLTAAEQKELNQNTTENQEALKLYWQGRFYWSKRTPEQIQKGIQYFEEAVRLDPNFAQAYAGLADSYALTASGLPSEERFPKAIASAQRALEINENLAEAHTSLAFVISKFTWDREVAENHYKRAIVLNEKYPGVHHWYGEFLILSGRFDEGFRELARAEKLDPLSIIIKTDTAEGLYRARRYPEALAQAKKVLEMSPDNIQIYRIIRRIQKQTSASEAEIVKTDLQTQRLSKVSPEDLALLEKLAAEQNWKVYWDTRLRLVSKMKVVPYFIEKAEIYMHIGERQAAVEQLSKQINNHELAPLVLREEPIFDSLHSNQKFILLLQLGGLQPRK